MVPCIKANGYRERISEMVEVYCYILMVLDTMAFGKMIYFTEEGDLLILMDEFTMESGKQERLMVMEFKKILMEINMKEIGLMISMMAKD